MEKSKTLIMCDSLGSLRGLIAPGCDRGGGEIAIVEHAADPIKDPREIKKMTDYFISRKKWRDLMLWIVGLNTALRVSDILRLRFGDLIDEEMSWRDEIVIQEKKTARTKKRAQNRHIAINDSIRRAVRTYLEHAALSGEAIALDTYMFRSESNNGRRKNEPIHRNTVEQILKKAARECGLDESIHVSCHTMRKTYAYHTLEAGGNDQRQLILLQKMLNHSGVQQTLTYAGVTADEMKDQYMKVNLGFGDEVAPARTTA